MKKKLFLLELNEFNLKFINSNIKKGKFIYIKKFLSFKYYKYRCDQREEINGLDPWTQWVNIHTGRRSSEHKLMQIGESKNLKFKQIWDYLSKKNILSGVWGVMNAKNYDSKNNKIFFPDPWNFTEEIRPVTLKMFFNFPSYLLKNYLDLSFFISLKKFISFALYLIIFSSPFNLIKKSFFIFSYLIKNGLNKYCFYPILDWLNLLIFLEYKSKKNLDLSIFFTNFIATTQHRIWNNKTNKAEIYFTFLILDRILKEIFESLSTNEEILVISGLSQEKINETVFHYRQINPKIFFEKLGLKNFKIEQNMSNDSMIFLNDNTKLNEYLNLLKSFKIKNKKLFYCEIKKLANQKYLFCRIIFYGKTNINTYIVSKNHKINFLEQCSLDAVRTGKHVPLCHVLSSINIKGKKNYNTDLFYQIRNYFT
jgi:hypothetical protein